MEQIFSQLFYEVEKHRDTVLVTLIADRGSAPRKAGAQMLVGAEGRLVGTIGGGAVEGRSIQLSQQLLAQRRSCIREFPLHQAPERDIGMVCGGDVTAHFQFIPAEDPLWSETASRALALLNRHTAGWLVLAVLLTAGLGCAAVLHMRPIIVSLATARVSNAVNRIVVDAVRDAIDSGQVDYNVLIHLEKDETGRVAALESNMAAFNRLRSQIADEILRRLSEVSTSELSIPVGTLTGSTLLAGRGPCIRVRMQAVGSTDASLRNAFSAAGINQTRHQILLSVDVYTSILLPGFTASTKVSNEIAVAETVIVGSVPETYTYFSTTPEELEDTARDNIMNKG